MVQHRCAWSVLCKRWTIRVWCPKNPEKLVYEPSFSSQKRAADDLEAS